MRGNVRFRVLLPIIMSVMNLLLAVWSSHENAQQLNAGTSLTARYQPVSLQNDAPAVGFRPVEIEPGIAVKVAIILNLPAVYAGLICASLLHRESEPAVIAVSTLFVPWLWLGIGRWIDRRRGILPMPTWPPSRARLIWVPLMRTAATFFLVVAIVGVTPLFRHRTEESAFMFGVMMLWSGAYLACIFWESRAARQTRAS
jgi:hypothetical protein